MPNVIRLGDPTSHGGQVTASGAPHFTVEGKPVALKGDACSCPKRGHQPCTIAEGDPDHTINGIPVAYEGHKTTCGATLKSTASNYSKSLPARAARRSGSASARAGPAPPSMEDVQ